MSKLYVRFQNLVLRVLKVPPEPQAPAGTPGSTQVFRASPAYLHLKLVRWGVKQVATAIGMGASVVRVGFEDSPFYAPGKAAIKNPELVERVVALTQHIGYDVASTEETREILQLSN